MNHPLRVVLLCTLMTILQTGWSQSSEMSMDQLIDYALANSPEMLDAQLKVQDAEAQILQSKSTGLPQVSGSGTYQRYFEVPIVPLPAEFTGGEPQEVSFVLKNNFTAGVNLDAMIFDAAYFVALKAARAARTYAQLELVDRQRQVRQQVRDVYLPVLLLQSNLAQLDKNLTNLEELYQETQQIYEAGFAEQLDVDRLALSLANLRTERDALDRQYENALRALKFTINYPAEQELTIGDDMEALLAEDNPEMLTTTVNYTRRPEINLLDQAIALSDYNIQNFKTGYLPSLRGFAGYQYQYQGNDFNSGFWAPTGFVGLTLNVPIYDGGFKRSQIDRATITRQQVQVQRSTVQRLIDLEVENARATYLSAQERFKDREDNLALAQRIYDTTQVKYREGVGSSLEVNQAEQALYTSQTNRLQAIYDVLQAKVALEEALGEN
ncbi:TolC family protein [Lewinella cohaerens]|uniref:TolC family protein n=1 Tax=Lewinella cohaerens TaxID=70995 RepID=UPI0006949CB8|nr:TolC family protein [Lewinella cohaerens]